MTWNRDNYSWVGKVVNGEMPLHVGLWGEGS